MTPSKSIKPLTAAQRGDMLIEALIGLVLMSIIGMGITYVTSRASVSQRDMQMQELAVQQMRQLLLANQNGAAAFCNNPPQITLPNMDAVAVVALTCDDATATIGGRAIAGIPRPVILSADFPEPIGRIVVGGNAGAGGAANTANTATSSY